MRWHIGMYHRFRGNSAGCHSCVDGAIQGNPPPGRHCLNCSKKELYNVSKLYPRFKNVSVKNKKVLPLS